jgi:hypothetical protein
MRLFRSEEDVPAGGAVMTIQALTRLATAWYGDRLDSDWQPRTRDESQAILEAAGLTGPFWELP